MVSIHFKILTANFISQTIKYVDNWWYDRIVNQLIILEVDQILPSHLLNNNIQWIANSPRVCEEAIIGI